MRDIEINLGVVAEIAHALGELNNSVVFVGGAVVAVYADDPAAEEVRPTEDVDLTLTLLDIDQQKLDARLAKLGFHLDLHGHAMCSYRYKDIAVDIMAATDTMRGPTNRWYRSGFESLQKLDVEGASIQILSAPYFLATKFEAFEQRGDGDYRTSHDFEDIIYVIDNRTTIVDEVRNADLKVRQFLSKKIEAVVNNYYIDEILAAHLNPLIAEERYPVLLEKLEKIIS